MKYMIRVYLLRCIAGAVAIAALAGELAVQRLVFRVTLDATQSGMIIGMIFVCVPFITAWVLSMIWKSTRDSSIYEMGIVELKVYEAVIKQAINAKEQADVDGRG